MLKLCPRILTIQLCITIETNYKLQIIDDRTLEGSANFGGNTRGPKKVNIYLEAMKILE